MKTLPLYIIALSACILQSCSSAKDVPAKIYGCTDISASNFDELATDSDNSCVYGDMITAEYFCTARAMAAVRIGMSKYDVKDILEIFPYDIMSADDGCEIHIYKSRHAGQELNTVDSNSEKVNTAGKRVYREEIMTYELFFRAGKLVSVISEASKSTLPHELVCLANSMTEICGSTEDFIVCSGCMNPLAENFDPNAEEDDASCTFNEGCMNILAWNYAAIAKVDDGSCLFRKGCTDPEGANFDDLAVIDDGGCTYIGCTDKLAINYKKEASHNQSMCTYCPCETSEYYYVKSENPHCDAPCIKMMRAEPVAEENASCDWCDVLNEAGGAKVVISVNDVKLESE